MSSIDLNPQFLLALEAVENSSKHLFITGRAGTGKSTLLEYVRSHTAKKYVVAAPTGVAALNVHGETIHSLFMFWPNISLEEAKKQAFKARKKRQLFQNLELLIIDEISMVRADLLDCVDIFLQTIRANTEPFGGVRVLCFGDLYQLPPVVRSDELGALEQIYTSPYFFHSHVFERLQENTTNMFGFIELEIIYRQKDQSFIDFLNGIRDKTISAEELEKLNARCLPDLDLHSLPEHTIILTARNDQADFINTKLLAELHDDSITFDADSSGDFERASYPTDLSVTVKPGARVMFVNNDSAKRWVNGTMGTVFGEYEEENGDGDEPILGLIIELDSGEQVEVTPYTWELSRSYFSENTKTIEREVVGTFTQIPLRLAWAVTIHKSQGKTFERIVVDLGRGAFTTGQTYVALSRCVSLEGLYLARPLKASDVRLDTRIVQYLTSLQYLLPEKK